MKVPKKIITAAAASLFSFSLAFAQQDDQAGTGAEPQPADEESPALQEDEQEQEFGQRRDRPEAAPGQSEEPPGQRTGQRMGRPETAPGQMRGQTSQAGDTSEIYELTDIEGLRVESQDGERLGTVESLAVDMEREEVSFIIVETGGVLGIGSELKVVPVDAVEITRADRIVGDREVLRVNIQEDRWDDVPAHEPDEIARLCEESEAREIYRIYGVDWEQRRTQEFGARQTEEVEIDTGTEEIEVETDTEELEVQDEPRAEQDGQTETRYGVRIQEDDPAEQQQDDETEFGARQEADDEIGEPQLDEEADSLDNGEQQEETDSEQEFGAPEQPRDSELDQADETEEDQERASVLMEEEQVQIEEEKEEVFGARDRRTTTRTTECELVMTRELRGTTIQSAQQEEIGSIDNMVVNLGTGRVQYILISPETGFLERTDEVFAIAPRSFRSITKEEVVLEVTREQLEQAEMLSETKIREHVRRDVQTGQETGQQPQVFRYQRDEITFGRRDRDTDEAETQEEDQAEPQLQEETEEPEFGVPPEDRGTDAGQRPDRPPEHAQDPDRRGPPDHAQDPDRRGPPDHARSREDRGAPEHGARPPRDDEQPEARDRDDQDDEDQEEDEEDSPGLRRGPPEDNRGGGQGRI